VSLYARIASSSFLADYGKTLFFRSDFYWVDQLSAGAEGAPTRYLFICWVLWDKIG
jgi:hypothetical protein